MKSFRSHLLYGIVEYKKHCILYSLWPLSAKLALLKCGSMVARGGFFPYYTPQYIKLDMESNFCLNKECLLEAVFGYIFYSIGQKEKNINIKAMKSQKTVY